MVLVNFAATRGPKQLWPGYTMRMGMRRQTAQRMTEEDEEMEEGNDSN